VLQPSSSKWCCVQMKWCCLSDTRTGTSRIIVVPSVKAVFTEKLLQRVAELKIGPGMTPGMDLGGAGGVVGSASADGGAGSVAGVHGAGGVGFTDAVDGTAAESATGDHGRVGVVACRRAVISTTCSKE